MIIFKLVYFVHVIWIYRYTSNQASHNKSHCTPDMRGSLHRPWLRYPNHKQTSCEPKSCLIALGITF